MRLCTLIISVLFFSCSENSDIMHFRVQNEGVSTPVELNINDIYISGIENKLGLFQTQGTKLTPIPFQIDTSGTKSIWFIADHSKDSEYILSREDNQNKTKGAHSVKKNGNLILKLGDIDILNYRYGMTYPPKGVDSIYRKSGFIHPIITPKGDTLSRIQPPDHYHHYGMWGPWTHTQIKGQQVDFWNLGDRKGTVLFKNFNSITSGPIFASFDAGQEHIDFITEKEPQVALDENLKITLWGLNRPDRYMFDYKTTFKTPLENGILFEAYRYGGGIGMRFTERWTADNCSVLTSEGKDRLSADGTNARWCIVKGESADGKSTNGVLFMSHSENRSHPEPMRIWPIDANGGRGDMFFEFCPIRHEEWKIEPQKEYQLKYRMVIFEDDLTAKEAEEYWQAFVKAPKMSLIKD